MMQNHSQGPARSFFGVLFGTTDVMHYCKAHEFKPGGAVPALLTEVLLQVTNCTPIPLLQVLRQLL